MLKPLTTKLAALWRAADQPPSAQPLLRLLAATVPALCYRRPLHVSTPHGALTLRQLRPWFVRATRKL